MEVKVNSKGRILKSIFRWMLMLGVVAPFYCLFLGLFVIWVLKKFIGLDDELARQISLPLSGVVVISAIYLYLNWFVKSLSSYRLAIEADFLHVSGRSGWRSLDRKVQVGEIQKIYVGGVASSREKAASEYWIVQDQIMSRLTFFPYHSESFKLDFAVKAFDNASLREFLIAMKEKGCETNVPV